jgi:mannitol/fructose-specific phosphotransferase system IIA component (Ntr-type)
MQLTEILSARHIRIPLQATTRNEAIQELLDLLVATGDVSGPEAAMAALLDRERTRTTGIGGGLALPHAKTPAAAKVVMALGRSPAGVDFQSIDGKPANLVVLLLGPMDATGPHIQALAKISRLLSIEPIRKRLDAASTPEQVLKIVAEHEKEEAEG